MPAPRPITVARDSNGRLHAYEAGAIRIPVNRAGYARDRELLAALRRFYIVDVGETVGTWVLRGMAHPDRAIAPRDEAFVGRMIDHDIAMAAKAPRYVETRTVGGEVIRRHGPFAPDAPALSHAWLAEMTAAETHNRMRGPSDRGRQRVFKVPA